MTTPADIEVIAQQLQAAGFLVLANGEVESAGAATLAGIAPKTLRNLRSQLDGPPWRLARGLVWYSIRDVLGWRGTSVSFTAGGDGTHPRDHEQTNTV